MSSSRVTSVSPSSSVLPRISLEVTNLATGDRPVLSLSMPGDVSPFLLNRTPSPDQHTIDAFFTNGIEKDDKYNSEKSSICESPVWNNAETKQKKKAKRMAREERRKEKQQAEKEVRARAKADIKGGPRRLVKAPPINRHSRMVLDDRSQSLPAISDIQNPLVKSYYPSESKVALRREGSNVDPRDQNALQPNGQDNPSPHETINRLSFQKIDSRNHADGFIGGMKLKMASEGTDEIPKEYSQDRALEQGPDTNMRRNSDQSPSAPSSKQHKRLHKARNSNFGVQKQVSPDIDKEQQDQYVRPANIAAPSTPKFSSILHRGIKRGHKTHSSITEYLFQDSTSAKLVGQEQDCANNCLSEVINVETSNVGVPTKAIKPPKKRAGLSERPPISYREPAALTAEISRGRTRSRRRSFADYREPSQDQCLDTEGYVSAGSEKSHSNSRKRSWSIRSLSRRMRSSSKSRNTTSGNMQTAEACENDHHFEFNINYFTPDSQTPKAEFDASDEQCLRRHRGIPHLNPATPFAGIKSVAKSAFSRHSYSSSFNGMTDGQALQEQEQLQARGCKDVTHTNYTTSKEASQTFGRLSTHSISPLPMAVVDSHHAPMTLASSASATHFNGQFILSHQHENDSFETNHSGATSISVENLAKPDISTTSTTPASSRPQSQKTDLPLADHFNSSILKSTSHCDVKIDIVDGGLGRDKLGTELDRSASTSVGTTTKDANQIHSLRKVLSSKKVIIEHGIVPNYSWQSLTPPGSFPSNDSHNLNISRNSFTNLEERALTKNSNSISTRMLPPRVVDNIGGTEVSSSRQLRGARVSALAKPKVRYPKIGESTEMSNIDPIAKMLVICCTCQYFQDMPSKLYELMAKPDDIVKDTAKGISGVISTSVKCPWCGHGMSVKCCEGYAAVVYLRERLH